MLPNPSQAPSRPCILIVEADLVVRHSLAEYLRQCGYRVIEAIDTDEAAKLLTTATVSIDIVLADARSPGRLDGFGLARWIRERMAGAKVILAASLEKVADEAGDLCKDGPTLTKPYDHQLLLDRIKRELARGDRLRSSGNGPTN